jgi:hypothetical protein
MVATLGLGVLAHGVVDLPSCGMGFQPLSHLVLNVLRDAVMQTVEIDYRRDQISVACLEFLQVPKASVKVR